MGAYRTRANGGVFRALAFVLGLLAFWAASPLNGQQSVGGVIAGRVIDARGQPQKVMVQLLSQADALVDNKYSDSSGLFSFETLPNGLYFVVIQQDGFQPLRQSFDIDQHTSSRYEVDLVLDPIEKEIAQPSPVIRGSPATYQFNLKKKGQAFDPRALREFERGDQKEREGKYDDAATHYRKALRIDPAFYPALNNLGAICLRRKDYSQAQADFLQSIDLNPDDGEAYINLGHLLYDRGKNAEAVQRLEQGIQRSPDSAAGHFFLGSVYLRLAELDKAETNLKAARSLDSSGALPAELQLANLYLKKQDLAAAGAELESYLKAHPSSPQAPAIKETLARIKAHPG